MPKKRTSPESSDDEPANTGSDSAFQQDEDSKRAKLVSLNNTTLQDLPIELIERILIKVIVMEVTDMNLMKRERKGKADPVIDRLRTVCSQWDSILTTTFFRNELNRTFDAQKMLRLELLHQCQPRLEISSLTTLKDEIFLLYGRYHGLSDNVALDVYDCKNIAVVKDVIQLPEIFPICIEGCSVSNCVYILHRMRSDYIRISRITKDGEHQFTFAQFIIGVRMSYPGHDLSVAADGSLLLYGWQSGRRRPVIIIYNADGSVQRQLIMHSDIPAFFRLIPMPNGNIVLVSADSSWKTILTEIDMDAKIIRQYQTSLHGVLGVFNAGMYGRMMLIDDTNKIELLDSELNLLEVTGPKLIEYKDICNWFTSHFNRDRNELVTVVHDAEHYAHRLLTIIGCSEK